MLWNDIFLLQVIVLFIIAKLSESIGSLCGNSTNNKSLLLLTFCAGSDQYLNRTPSSFNFNTTYDQRLQSGVAVGRFGFVNAVPGLSLGWHTGELDHTSYDVDGYMLVFDGSTDKDSKIFDSTVSGLRIRTCYEFSAYVANILKSKDNRPKPDIRFEIRSTTDPRELFAQINTGEIPQYDKMTWTKYGLSFNASSSSVILLMILNDGGEIGRDLAIDDIELRVCSSIQSDFCPSGSTASSSGSDIDGEKPILSITFCAGNQQVSNRTPSSFSFDTAQIQIFSSSINPGYFGFMNKILGNNYWHVGAEDHTPNDVKGYMFVVDVATDKDTLLFQSNVDGLRIGVCYEFSAYVANIDKKNRSRPQPDIHFVVRSMPSNTFLGEIFTGNIPQYNSMTWAKYGLSFNASSSLVILSMRSNVQGNNGNNIAIDDIELRVCSTDQSDFCLSGAATTSQRTSHTTVQKTPSTAEQQTSSRTTKEISSTSVQQGLPTTPSTTVQQELTTTPMITNITKSSTDISSTLVFDISGTSTASEKDSSILFIAKPCNNSRYIGTNCNVSTSPCQMMSLCGNNGNCIDDYNCSCSPGFHGTPCELDHRFCTSRICFDTGLCNETLNVSNHCKCPKGWQGIYCESMINYCDGSCKNNAVCRPLPGGFKCECLGDGYYGQYCEHMTRKILIKKIVSRSLAYIAILAMITVAMFVVVMDTLKYCFGIDPTREDLEEYRREKRAQKRKRPVVERFIYIDETLPSPTEEKDC